MSHPVSDEHFQISTVARLTGLTVPNIRTWEKRYEMVTPHRSDTGRRLYTRDDIQHLSLLKSLVDAGHAIGSIASLSTEQLDQRLRESETNISVGCRVLLVGDSLLALYEDEEDYLADLTVVSAYPTLADCVEDVSNLANVDLMIVSCPTLFADTVERIQRLVETSHARRAILVYNFAPGDVLKNVSAAAGITAIRGPVNAEELRLACLADIRVGQPRGASDSIAVNPLPPNAEIPPHLYSPRQLAKLTKSLPQIQCECPKHLSNLLFSLTAFEAYSSECESRNPADEAVHASLYQSTARARVLIEESLAKVLEHESIEI